MLDTCFPYESASVNIPLISEDSPGFTLFPQRLKQGKPNPYPQNYDKYYRNDSFKTYLIYRPTGNSTIWVTLSVIEWGWSGTAEYISNEWELTAGGVFTCGDYGTETSVLPEWDDNIVNYAEEKNGKLEPIWVDI